MILKDGGSPNVQVTDSGFLKVCLCEKCCEGHIRLEDLMFMYPCLNIQIEKPNNKENLLNTTNKSNKELLNL